MASENTDKDSPRTGQPGHAGGEQRMSMKERLLAQRRAQAGAAEQPAPAREQAPARTTHAASHAVTRADRAPDSARSSSAKRKGPSVNVMHEVEAIRRQQDKWITYGWVTGLIMLLAAGGIWMVVQGKKTRIEEERLRYEREINDFVTRVERYNIEIEREAQALIEEVDGNKDWKTTYLDGVTGRVAGMRARAQNSLDRKREQRELSEGLATVEAAARDASLKRPEELAQLRRRLVEYENKGGLMGAEFDTRVLSARTNISRAYVRRLLEEARNLASQGPAQARAALAAYTKAEEEIQTLVDDAFQRRSQEAQEFIVPLYQACIVESDTLVAQVFTPEVIDKTPWRDILQTIDLKDWGQAELKGFRIQNGVLQAVGPDAGAKKVAIFSVGDREKWRDFVLECEFQLVRGTTEFYFRLGKQVNTAEGFVVNPASKDDWKLGQAYSFTAKFLGSSFIYEFSANADRDPYQGELSWTRSRRGAFGATLPEGAEMRLTRLRIKVLR